MRKILLSSVVAIALLTGCGEDKKVVETKVEEVSKAVETKVEEVAKAVETKVEEVAKVVETKTPEAKLVEQVKESTSTVATKIAEESKKVAALGTDAVKSVTEKVAAKTEEVTKEVVAKATETKDKIEDSMNNIVATKTEAKADTASLAEKGKGLYLKCAGCHGANAEKPALGKSQVIKGWDASKIAASLKGYKDGSYGGVMKGVMKGQVANLSDEEINALGAYIASF